MNKRELLDLSSFRGSYLILQKGRNEKFLQVLKSKIFIPIVSS